MATRDYSDEQEKRIAKLLNGRVTPNSGGTRFGAGDVITDYFLIEAKTSTTPKKSFSVKKEWIDKAEEQAFEIGKENSAVAISFGDGKDYFLINSQLFKEFLDYKREQGYCSSGGNGGTIITTKSGGTRVIPDCKII